LIGMMGSGKTTVARRQLERRAVAAVPDSGFVAAARPLLEGDTPAAVRLGEILESRKQVYTSLATDLVESDVREMGRVMDDVIGIWES